jgi:hypothetical protein
LRARITTPWTHAASVAAAVVALMSVASADGVPVMERPRPEYDPKGIPVGAFRAFPTVVLRLNTTNNVFESDNDQKSDVFIDIAPSLRLTSEWSRHYIEFFANLNSSRFTDFESEDTTDWSVGAAGRLDIRRGDALSAAVSKAGLHERRSSPNSPGTIREPIAYTLFRALAAIVIQPNRLRAELSGQFDRVEYENTPLNGGGVLDNGDRDRDELRLRARVSLEIGEGYRTFVEGVYDRRDFDRAIDRTGVNRDSTGTSLMGGLQFELAEFLQGDIFVGYLDRQFGAPLQDFSGFNFGAALKWSATPLTTIHMQALRELSDTVVVGGSAISDRRLSVAVDHELLRNVIIQGSLSYVDSEFVGLPRNDEQYEGRVGAIYLIDDSLTATVGYERLVRDSNAFGETFSEQRFNVGFRFRL